MTIFFLLTMEREYINKYATQKQPRGCLCNLYVNVNVSKRCTTMVVTEVTKATRTHMLEGNLETIPPAPHSQQ